MILILSGEADVARVALAEKIAKQRPDWRHFPLDQVEQMMPEGELTEMMDDEMLFQLACNAIRELKDEGLSVVVSHPDLGDSLDLLREELDEELVAIQISNEEDDGFDLTIDEDTSVNEAYAGMAEIIEEKSEEQ